MDNDNIKKFFIVFDWDELQREKEYLFTSIHFGLFNFLPNGCDRTVFSIKWKYPCEYEVADKIVNEGLIAPLDILTYHYREKNGIQASFERVISHYINVMVEQKILKSPGNNQKVAVFIFSPPLPKLIGRISYLYFPENYTFVFWDFREMLYENIWKSNRGKKPSIKDYFSELFLWDTEVFASPLSLYSADNSKNFVNSHSICIFPDREKELILDELNKFKKSLPSVWTDKASRKHLTLDVFGCCFNMIKKIGDQPLFKEEVDKNIEKTYSKSLFYLLGKGNGEEKVLIPRNLVGETDVLNTQRLFSQNSGARQGEVTIELKNIKEILNIDKIREKWI